MTDLGAFWMGVLMAGVLVLLSFVFYQIGWEHGHTRCQEQVGLP